MYVGDVGARGLHLLLFQLLTVSLAEFAEGQGSILDVLLRADGSVADEGRGIPVTHHPDLGMPILQVLLTGAEWGRHVSDAERVSRDPWPLTVANCLAEWLRVETRYGGQAYQQEYRRGEPVLECRRVRRAQR